MRMACWIARRKISDRCQYPRRAEDPGCDQCALQHIDAQGRTPSQAEAAADHLREQARAARLSLRGNND